MFCHPAWAVGSYSYCLPACHKCQNQVKGKFLAHRIVTLYLCYRETVSLLIDESPSTHEYVSVAHYKVRTYLQEECLGTDFAVGQIGKAS